MKTCQTCNHWGPPGMSDASEAECQASSVNGAMVLAPTRDQAIIGISRTVEPGEWIDDRIFEALCIITGRNFGCVHHSGGNRT